MNIKQILEKTAEEVPQKTAIVLGPERVSYQELDERSNRIANALISLGMKKGDHVAILMPCTPEWVFAYFGIVKAGGKTVILNSMLKAPEFDSLLRDSDSRILITEKSFSQMLSSILPDIPLLKHVIEVDSDSYTKMMADSSPASPVVDIKDDDESAIIYTSGVLGKQKGVVHTHTSLMAAATIVAPGLEQKRDDVCISMIPFFYALGLVAVVLPSFMKGSTVVILPRFTPANALETITQEKATMLVGVPAMYNALAMLDGETVKRYNLSSLRVALTAGAKASAHLMETLEEKFGLTLCEIYGTTEALATTFGDIHNRKLGTAGKPVEEIKLIDTDGKEVPQGEIGELVCRSPQVMKKYYKEPELTARVLKDGWFHSGDLVRMDEDGYIDYIEKKSFIIVTSAGVKIPPTEVEDVLLKHPSVAEAAYVGVMDELKGQIPTLFVVPKEGQTITKKGIREFCRQSLANYKLPHKIELVESIPKTGSGKIDRRRLKEGRTV
ncbi:MAG: class I adenylate-forming enzyme family protein [Dehalococcoidia bacterium]